MSPMQLPSLSRDIEERTGADSIDTIEKHYRGRLWNEDEGGYDDADYFVCVWPECTFRSEDVETLWLHVHVSGDHGLSLEPGDLAKVRRTKAWTTVAATPEGLADAKAAGRRQPNREDDA